MVELVKSIKFDSLTDILYTVMASKRIYPLWNKKQKWKKAEEEERVQSRGKKLISLRTFFYGERTITWTTA